MAVYMAYMYTDAHLSILLFGDFSWKNYVRHTRLYFQMATKLLKTVRNVVIYTLMFHIYVIKLSMKYSIEKLILILFNAKNGTQMKKEIK